MTTRNANATDRVDLGRRLYARRAALLATGVVALGALLSQKAVPCGFAQLTGHPCPGCGSTRAVLALVHGDVAGVVRYNPLGPVMAVLLGVLAVQAFVSVLFDGDFRRVAEGRWLRRLVAAVVVLESVLWISRFFGAFGGPVPV